MHPAALKGMSPPLPPAAAPVGMLRPEVSGGEAEARAGEGWGAGRLPATVPRERLLGLAPSMLTSPFSPPHSCLSATQHKKLPFFPFSPFMAWLPFKFPEKSIYLLDE